MTTSKHYQESLETAAALLGRPLDLPLGPGEPASGAEFRRLATEQNIPSATRGRAADWMCAARR
jgi:hypothetical protein